MSVGADNEHIPYLIQFSYTPIINEGKRICGRAQGWKT